MARGREFFYVFSCLGIDRPGRKSTMSKLIKRGLDGVRQFGPYAAVELLVPGGSLIAVAMYLYRRHKRMEMHS